MSGGCFHTLSIVQFLGTCHELHERVAQGHGRIVLTRDGCQDICILISKAELDSLERALEILSQTNDFHAMCQSLSSVVSESRPGSATQTA